ncbi:MAG: AMP-binding protein [Acidimicrobiales bacterium]
MLKDFNPRTVPAELTRRWTEAGFWNDDTLAGVLATGLRRHRKETVRVFSERRPFIGTVADVAAVARRLASGLREFGIGPGDVVAYQVPNWMEAIASFWGIGLLGATVLPVVHIYGHREMTYILEHAGARALLTADRFGHLDFLEALPEYRRRVPSLELIAAVGDTSGECISFDRLTDFAEPGHTPLLDPDAPALVAFTSGTTAEPKGVVHSHRTLLAEVRQLARLQAPPSPYPALVGSPVSHTAGMLGSLLMSIVYGNSINLIDRWDAGAVLGIMREAGLQVGGGATYFLTSILDHPDLQPEHLEHVRHVALGGAPIPAAVAERAHSLGISLIRTYGSTEHPSVTAGSHHDPSQKRLYSDGRPLPGVELRLLDETDQPVGPGQLGAIHSRGPDCFTGYTDPSLTAGAVDQEGWYETGDIGVLDEDGYLTITDRAKDIIIRGGENISAAEVEELLQQMPTVSEVAVVAAPDERMGEHACAVVRPRSGVPPPDLAAVRLHLEQAGLARQKWPEELLVVNEFDRTPSGKIKKNALRDRLRGRGPV